MRSRLSGVFPLRLFIHVVFLFCVSLTATSSLTASPILFDPYKLLRTGRFTEIRNYFRDRKPENRMQLYAKATSLAEAGPSSTTEAIATYLAVMGLYCPKSDSEADFLSCLAPFREEYFGDLMDRLSLWKAAEICPNSWDTLKIRLLSVANLAHADPLSRNIYTKRLQLILSQDERAAILAKRHPALQAPRLNFLRARAAFDPKDKDVSLEFYVASLVDAPAYVTKDTLKDLRLRYPFVFQPDTSKEKEQSRNLVHSIRYMTPVEKKSYIGAYSSAEILETSSATTLTADGLLLIEKDENDHLETLAAKFYSQIFADTSILRAWVESLLSKSDYNEAYALLEKYPNVKKQEHRLWRNILELKKKQKDPGYFDELVHYLQVHHDDVEIHDDLITYLIGEDTQKIHFAHEKYWTKVYEELPAQTGNGRFVYWYRRYAMATKNAALQQEIEDNFYVLAPGSYYARAMWDIAEKGDYAKDWNQVKDRESYLRWVGKYGGSTEALRFLAWKDLSRYTDARAYRLEQMVRNAKFGIPPAVIELYRLGEYALGLEFYKDVFGSNISKGENYARLAAIGKESDNLFYSVYFTRSLMRTMDIPEDPFSLPPSLLREVYPRPYYGLVVESAKQYKIEEAMVYGLMRQESMFREVALSKSGAKGLMQIMPATGKWLNSSMKLGDIDLFDPETSIKMGTKFFADLLRSNDDDFRWASIAYNAGPGNLRKWKGQLYRGDFNFFLENIPKAEPRNYCRSTYQNYMHYVVTYTLYP